MFNTDRGLDDFSATIARNSARILDIGNFYPGRRHITFLMRHCKKSKKDGKDQKMIQTRELEVLGAFRLKLCAEAKTLH